MRLFSIIAILFFLSSFSQSTGPAHSSYDHCVRNALELMPESPDIEFDLLAQTHRARATCALEHGNFDLYLRELYFSNARRHFDDIDIARLKQIALEAATSAEAWSRFGGQRFIEGPFNVDPTQIEYQVLGNFCLLFGATVERDGNCDRVRLTVPTDQYVDQYVGCAIVIEVFVNPESGMVVEMKDSLHYVCSIWLDTIAKI